MNPLFNITENVVRIEEIYARVLPIQFCIQRTRKEHFLKIPITKISKEENELQYTMN